MKNSCLKDFAKAKFIVYSDSFEDLMILRFIATLSNFVAAVIKRVTNCSIRFESAVNYLSHSYY